MAIIVWLKSPFTKNITSLHKMNIDLGTMSPLPFLWADLLPMKLSEYGGHKYSKDVLYGLLYMGGCHVSSLVLISTDDRISNCPMGFRMSAGYQNLEKRWCLIRRDFIIVWWAEWYRRLDMIWDYNNQWSGAGGTRCKKMVQKHQRDQLSHSVLQCWRMQVLLLWRLEEAQKQSPMIPCRSLCFRFHNLLYC